jgi:hypothetical protein
MPKPKDIILYNKIKSRIYKKIPKHSAYRSGVVVKTYKKSFSKKYGKRKSPYSGKKTHKKGLKRWFKEKWVNQRGKVGYKYKSDIYRPSKRITRKTPTTHSELSRKQIKRARSEKRRTGRVKRFKKTRNQRGGRKMVERITKFKRGPFPKKYTAYIKHIKDGKTRKIHFGDRRYQQYKDRVPLGLYKHKNHNTRKRMRNYFSRHSGTKKRGVAIKKEKMKSKGKYNAKILSHVYLW